METVEFRGNKGDLGRFARHALKQAAVMDQPSPFERRIRWDAADRVGFGSTVDLRSGIKLATAKLSWSDPWAFRTREAATPLKFMLGRGAGPRVTLSDTRTHALGGGVVQIRHSTRPVSTMLEFDADGAEFETVALEIDPGRLKELLGAPTLPGVLESLLANEAPWAMHEQPLTPALARISDEVLNVGANGVSRHLFLEARGLELLASLIDELVAASEAFSPLTAFDIERLERARRCLLERLASPPSLSALARSVGLNEFKLKAGFRTLFGDSVFGYLRKERMSHARRLLADGRLSVLEVAARVGYANPSKFAAAFRKQFGFPPSAVR